MDLARSPVGPLATLTLVTAAIAALTMLLAGTPYLAHPPLAPVFFFLFERDEPAAAWLSCGLLLLALIGARVVPETWPGRIAARLTARPRGFIAVTTVLLAVAAVVVYRAYPLAMDESAALFQARAFAHLRLTGKVPPELVQRVVLQAPFWFLQALPNGQVIQSYWPSFALLLAPFAAAGVPWLLNPLIGGATLFAVHRLARKLWPETAAPGWAVLLTAASPAFTVNAISFYSMPAHLLATLLFSLLMLDERYLAAGALGSVALTLHNPLPHVLVALPFLVSVALRPGRARALLRLAAGYLPGSLLLGLGWFAFRSRFPMPAAGGGGGAAGLASSMAKMAFAAPSWDLLRDRVISLCELSLWAPPALLALAFLGARVRWREPGARLVALSALVTLAGYFFVPFDQGHGWGFRYFHPAWGALPLLGAAALVSMPSLSRLMLILAAGSLLANTALRFRQVQSFIDGQRNQLPQAPQRAGFEVVMVHVARGYYAIDLVQNDPFLDSRRWMLISTGPADDRHFMQAAFPQARLVAENQVATVWQIE